MIRVLVLVLLVGSALLSGFVHAKTPVARRAILSSSWCRDSDAVVASQLAYYRRIDTLTAETDTLTRHVLQLPAITPEAIAYVSDSTPCRRAAESIRRHENGADTGALATLYLISWGPLRMLGSGNAAGEWNIWSVFDRSSTVISVVAQ